MPEFNFKFTVKATLKQVRDFHSDTTALKRLTPPPTIVQLHDVEPLSYGEAVALIMRLEWIGSGIEIGRTHVEELFGNQLTFSFHDLDSFQLTPLIPILEEMNLPSPLDGLPDLIKMVLHETDTFYLDACPLCGHFSGTEFEWREDCASRPLGG